MRKKRVNCALPVSGCKVVDVGCSMLDVDLTAHSRLLRAGRYQVKEWPMIRLRFGCMAVYFAVAASAFGDSSSFDFTVAAGRHERNNVPVRLQMPRGQIGKERIASVTLARADGQLIPAQWTGPGLTSSAAGELHFVLPHLAAGESVRLNATLSTQSPSSKGGFTWRDHPGHHADLMFGDRSIITYHY